MSELTPTEQDLLLRISRGFTDALARTIVTTMIEFNDVSKIYDKKPAQHSASLTIETGEFFIIVGTSGSGKMTT